MGDVKPSLLAPGALKINGRPDLNALQSSCCSKFREINASRMYHATRYILSILKGILPFSGERFECCDPSLRATIAATQTCRFVILLLSCCLVKQFLVRHAMLHRFTLLRTQKPSNKGHTFMGFLSTYTARAQARLTGVHKRCHLRRAL